MITSTKHYVPVVTLSINYNIKFVENTKQGFKRTVSWNKYKSEIKTQPKRNNLNNLIDPTFRNISRMSVLSFKNGNDDPARDSFDKYSMPLIELKGFNELITINHFLINQQKPSKKRMRNFSKCQEIIIIQQEIYYII